jgi:hypothetical protein
MSCILEVSSRDLPKSIARHYRTSNSRFATIRGLLKTHKPGPDISIRPIVNIKPSPVYKLTWLLFSILRPLASTSAYSLKSSTQLIEFIRAHTPEDIRSHPYPFSLDVKNMYTSIPPDGAVRVAMTRLSESQICLYGLHTSDIERLLSTILNSSFLIFNKICYKQVQGLAMGSRLSGLLADLFLSHIEHQIVPTLNVISYRRYVDDIFMLTTDDSEACEILSKFKNCSHGLDFDLERPSITPTGHKISLLDITVAFTDDRVSFEFYRKPSRSDIFLHRDSALPIVLKQNVIRQEWKRILDRVDDPTLIDSHKNRFRRQLLMNGYSHLPSLSQTRRNNIDRTDRANIRKFFLSIPFFNDSINHKIHKIVKELGIPVFLCHKGTNLLTVASQNFASSPSCTMRWCSISSKECFNSRVVYKCTCSTCNATYIGSTIRPYHTRIREHLSSHSSAVFSHNLTCNAHWSFNVINRFDNNIDTRLGEAVAISLENPNLNTRSDFMNINLFI